ncbi:hypothetical protein ACRRTK_013037 [Alexandromys fortis]
MLPKVESSVLHTDVLQCSVESDVGLTVSAARRAEDHSHGETTFDSLPLVKRDS